MWHTHIFKQPYHILNIIFNMRRKYGAPFWWEIADEKYGSVTRLMKNGNFNQMQTFSAKFKIVELKFRAGMTKIVNFERCTLKTAPDSGISFREKSFFGIRSSENVRASLIEIGSVHIDPIAVYKRRNLLMFINIE